MAGRVGLALGRGRQAAHEPPVRMMPADERLTGDDHGGGPVVGRPAHHRGERLRDHPRAQDLVDGHGVIGPAVGQRVQRAVVPVLGRDRGEDLGLGAMVVHAPLRPEGEERGGKDGGVQLVPPRPAAHAGGR